VSETIEKILNTAVHAPSGDNLQPWQFGIKDNRLYIFNIPEKDQSSFNFRQLGSCVGHGALIENISIGASYFGLKTSIKLFPENIDNLVATIDFDNQPLPKDELYEYITKRTTNRKPYKNEPLKAEHDTELTAASRELGFGNVKLIAEPSKKTELAKIATTSERMIMENKTIHDFLYQHIVWTEKEEAKNRSGLYVKTLEISPAQEKGFKIAGNWFLVSILNKFGFSKKFANQTVGLYDSSAAIGAVIVENNNNLDFVLAGRIMQRLWLKATKLGLSIQPLTAVLFLHQRILGQETTELSKPQIDLIESNYQRMAEIFEVGSKTIGMMFRIGIADKPSAYSSKLPPVIVPENKLNEMLKR